MSRSEGRFDLMVIGAGPGGYTAAVRAAKGGRKTALVESGELGGVCLNWGCIPTKALLHSAGMWRGLKGLKRHGLAVEGASFDYPAVVRRSRQVVTRLVKGLDILMSETGVAVLRGRGRLSGVGVDGIEIEIEGDEGRRRVESANVILATGGVTRSLPGLPFDGKRVLSSRDAVTMTKLPERLLVVGAGAIGLEFADLFSTFGVKVTVVELLPQILPTEDEDVAQVLRDALSKRGVRIRTGVRFVEPIVTEDGISGRIVPADWAGAESGDSGPGGEEVAADCALVAVGVGGAVDGLGLEQVGLQQERGFLRVDEMQRTATARIYAIGDLTGPPLLAHLAAAEGVCAAEHLLGSDPAPVVRNWIPGAVFTHPQVASVGARERELSEKGVAFRTGRFPFSALGKAVAEGEVAGFVKVLVAEEGGALLGAHAVGPMASELIAELTLAGTHGVDGRKVLRTLHTHPTLSEAIPEAFGAAFGLGIHG